MKDYSKFIENNRPSIEFVANVFKRIFDAQIDIKYIQLENGPDRWVWAEDEKNVSAMYYILSTSEKIQGYPKLTIEQVISTNLDSSLSTSCIVSGLTENEIIARFNAFIANHTCAYAGLSVAVNTVVESGGDYLKAIDMASKISELSNFSFGVDKEIN